MSVPARRRVPRMPPWTLRSHSSEPIYRVVLIAMGGPDKCPDAVRSITFRIGTFRISPPRMTPSEIALRPPAPLEMISVAQVSLPRIAAGRTVWLRGNRGGEGSRAKTTRTIAWRLNRSSSRSRIAEAASPSWDTCKSCRERRRSFYPVIPSLNASLRRGGSARS